jgi:hypothetical protein
MKLRYELHKSTIHVYFDLSGFEGKLENAQKVLNYQIIADTSKFVPFKQGILSNSVHVENENEIVYQTPYARFQYMGKVMVGIVSKSPFARVGERKRVVPGRDIIYDKTAHPEAGSRWFERAAEEYESDWIRAVKNAVK